MKIHTRDLDVGYEFASSFSQLDFNKTESWKQGSNSEPKLETRMMNYASVELPLPLGSVTFQVSRLKDIYAIRFYISARVPACFEKLSWDYAQAVRDRLPDADNIRFSPTSQNLSGYFYDVNSKPEGVIIEAGQTNQMRIFCFGAHGSSHRKLGTVEEFRAGVHKLEKLVNIALNLTIPKTKDYPESLVLDLVPL